MNDHLAEPITGAATLATINLSKIGTVSGAVVAGGASFFGEYGVAILGLSCTILFGTLGLLVSHHFKAKEFNLNRELRLKEDKRRDEEHAATMARLTGR